MYEGVIAVEFYSSVIEFHKSRYDQSIKTDIGKPFDKSISIDNF